MLASPRAIRGGGVRGPHPGRTPRAPPRAAQAILGAPAVLAPPLGPSSGVRISASAPRPIDGTEGVSSAGPVEPGPGTVQRHPRRPHDVRAPRWSWGVPDSAPDGSHPRSRRASAVPARTSPSGRTSCVRSAEHARCIVGGPSPNPLTGIGCPELPKVGVDHDRPSHGASRDHPFVMCVVGRMHDPPSLVATRVAHQCARGR